MASMTHVPTLNRSMSESKGRPIRGVESQVSRGLAEFYQEGGGVRCGSRSRIDESEAQSAQGLIVRRGDMIIAVVASDGSTRRVRDIGACMIADAMMAEAQRTELATMYLRVMGASH